MMGLESNENLIFNTQPWPAYVPLVMRTYPFVLIPKQQSLKEFTVFDMASNLVNDKEGERIFDEAGAEPDYLVKIKPDVSFCQPHTNNKKPSLNILHN